MTSSRVEGSSVRSDTGGDKYRFGDNTRGILYRGELKRELKLLKAKMQVHLS